MKEQTLIEIKNKVETLGKVNNYLMSEVAQLKDLAIGTLETIKQMDAYEQAIEDLKKKMAEESSKAKEADASREAIKQIRIYGDGIYDDVSPFITRSNGNGYIHNSRYVIYTSSVCSKTMELSSS